MLLVTHTHASHWLYEQRGRPSIQDFQGGWIPPVRSGTCAICLSDQYDTIAHFHMSESYTNYDLHQDNRTKRVCLACLYTFQNEFRNKYLQMVLDESGLQTIKSGDKEQFNQWIWNPEKKVPFAAAMTKDFKKHILFRAPIQYSSTHFQIAWGEEFISIEIDIHQPIYEAIVRLRAIGVPLIRMKTQQFFMKDQAKYRGLSETFDADLALIYPYRYQRSFEFLCSLTSAQKQEKD